MSGCKGCSCHEPPSLVVGSPDARIEPAPVTPSIDTVTAVDGLIRALRAGQFLTARDRFEALVDARSAGATPPMVDGAMAGAVDELRHWLDRHDPSGTPIAVEALMALGYAETITRHVAELLRVDDSEFREESCAAIERGAMSLDPEARRSLFWAIFAVLREGDAESSAVTALPCVSLLVALDVDPLAVHEFLWPRVVARESGQDLSEVAAIALARSRPTPWLLEQIVVALKTADVATAMLGLYVIESLPGPVDARPVARALQGRAAADWERDPLASILARPPFAEVRTILGDGSSVTAELSDV